MAAPALRAMLATLGGFLALLVGLLVLLLPLLASELSRARDSVWGAVVLLLGLVLVTSAERLTGAPMLAVLCGGLLIGRLGVEVGQARWRQLTDEERQRLWSWERWRTSLAQLGASLGRLLQLAAGLVTELGTWLKERRASRPITTKRWVRPEKAPAETPAETASESPADAPARTTDESPADATAGTAAEAPPEPPPAELPAPAAGETPMPPPAELQEAETEEALVVSDFEAIDALIDRAPPETAAPEPPVTPLEDTGPSPEPADGAEEGPADEPVGHGEAG